MPYIRYNQREKYNDLIDKIGEQLPTDLEGLDGHLNYVICRLVLKLSNSVKGGKKQGYHKRKVLIHTVYAAADELRRTHLEPYEIQREHDNGGVLD